MTHMMSVESSAALVHRVSFYVLERERESL